MGEVATVKVADGEFSAYVARGAAPGAPAVVVIQEIFGVNEVMRRITDRVAAKGYLAICPDLFWRIEPNIDITDQSDAEWKRAFELYQAFDVDKGVGDIGSVVRHVADNEGAASVGAIGFCLGGLLAFLTAARTPARTCVGFYGVGIDQHLGESTAGKHLMLHIAEEDQFVPPPAQAAILEALGGRPDVALHTYPGCDHAFAREGGQHYNPAAADLAWRRTFAFLQENL